MGEVTSEPELRSSEEKKEPHSVVFNLSLSIQQTTFGWIKVLCYPGTAELAAREVHKGMKVLAVGYLIRGSLQVKDNTWWSEVILVPDTLEVIK
jgi:single-stranded DNA-binding protein